MTRFSAVAYILGLAIFLSSCSNSEKKQEESAVTGSRLPSFALIDSASFDFGTINEGEIVEHTFRFKNGGTYPLIINNISSSCGCTTPEWPREPVKSGESSDIKVRFDSKNKSGPQVKTITVYANTEPSQSEFRLKGLVNSVPKSDSIK